MNSSEVGPRTRALARFRRWHTWGGLTAGLLLLVAGASGIVLNYKRPFFAMLGVEADARPGRALGERARPPESREPQPAGLSAAGLSQAPVSLERALALARETWGDVAVERIEVRLERGALLYRIRARSGAELQINATTGTHFVRGEYEKVKTAADGTVAARTVDWGRILLDLHTGRIGGEAGKAIMSAAALLLIWLTLSGVYLWLKPLRLRRENATAKSIGVHVSSNAHPVSAREGEPAEVR